MKKKLNKYHTLYFDKYFPYTNKKRSSKKHFVTLGVGANIPNERKRFEKLYQYIKRDKLLSFVQSSPILKNPPFGYTDQAYFYNTCIIIKTNLNPMQLLKHILKIEKKFKRERKFTNSPRTLDLDIIFFAKIRVNKKNLTIPHPKYKDRDSVMIPLSFIKKGKTNEVIHFYSL